MRRGRATHQQRTDHQRHCDALPDRAYAVMPHEVMPHADMPHDPCIVQDCRVVAARVLDRVIRTEPFVSAGKSGSALERGWLDDGTAVIIKHADARQDWIMRATGDDGRVAALWSSELFDRLPASVDHATLDVQRGPGRAVVVMRDGPARRFDDRRAG